MPSSNTSRIRLFASVDLIGSTAYKNSFEQTDRSNGQKSPPWYKVFEEFYLQFVDALKGQCQASSVLGGTQAVGMEFFKAIGDELVFQQTIETHREAIEYIKALRASLAEYNEKLKGRSLPLRVKGSAWIAGFPINNAEIELPDGRRDFLGPSIDAGFRISKFASERKLAVSVDLALLLTASVRTGTAVANNLEFYFDGTERLRGVLGERPYPLIWVAASQISEEERLLGIQKNPCDVSQLYRYSLEYVQRTEKLPSWLIQPYFPEDELFNQPCAWHQKILDHWRIADGIMELGSPPSDEEARPAYGTASLMMPEDIAGLDHSEPH